jgi:trimeric autotransporter adhesin
MKWTRALQVLGLAVVAAAIPACLSSNPNSSGPQPAPVPAGTTFKAARLSGRQEVPAVTTSATGSATMVIDLNRKSMTVTVEVSGLSNITEAHLHVGRPGVDGPIIFPLASTAFTSPLTVTLTEAELQPNPPASTFEQALFAVETGNTYVNVHTTAFPDGEIRGQVGPVEMMALLSGDQEVPTVLTFATGSLSLTLSADQTTMLVSLNMTGIESATAAHIHVGPAGVDGPIIFPLAQSFYQVPLALSLTSADLTPQPGIATFEDTVDAILSGATYANIHTLANPDGEIRGQIVSP